MTQPLSLPPCKHTMPVGAVVIVDSVLPSLRCSFCEVEELRAEVARLRAGVTSALAALDGCWKTGCASVATWTCRDSAGDRTYRCDDHKILNGGMLGKSVPFELRTPRALQLLIAGADALAASGLRSDDTTWNAALTLLAEQGEDPQALIQQAGENLEKCRHVDVELPALIPPEAWVGDLPSGVTPWMVRAIQANARNAAIEEAKAAIAKAAAERPLNAPLQEYAKGFAEVLEALKTPESA